MPTIKPHLLGIQQTHQLKGSEKSPQSHRRPAPFFGEGISILPRTRRALAASELLFNSFSIMWSLGSILFKKDQLEKKSDILPLKPGKLQCSGNHGKLQIVFVGWKKIHVAQTFKTQMLPALRIMGSQNYSGLEIPEPCYTDPNPSFSEGSMILRAETKKNTHIQSTLPEKAGGGSGV